MTDSAVEYDIAPLIEALQDPTVYPHPVEAIHVVQTHTACVFLTGEYAYKIKKPVNFGFLDYGTLEQRHALCEQELILNRRLCPNIYLEVLPVTRHPTQLQFGGDGPAVEWAVKMRQLREADMLPARLQTNTLEETTAERLAQTLAAFHTQAHTDDGIRAYGSPDAIADTIAITLRTMKQVIETIQQTAEHTAWFGIYQGLYAYFGHFLEFLKPLFQTRCETKRIRDCHGDLRAQNICLDARFEDGLQIFDCIEFNAALRCIDTAADIAYLAMDLDLAGHADLRVRLMEVYAREMNDPDLAAILPFYLVYRAMVRGNIALLAAQESEIPLPERQAQREMAFAAYDLARAYAGLRTRPALLITVGYSGCGKSVLAQEVSRRLPAIHLSSDRIRKKQVGMAVSAHLELSAYASAQRQAVYATLFEQAAPFLERREHVLFDATFLDAQQRDAAAALARTHNAEFWILECHCPDALIRQRLSARGEDPNASDAGLNVYLQQRATFPPGFSATTETAASGHRLLLDMTQPVNDLAHAIVSRLLAT